MTRRHWLECRVPPPLAGLTLFVAFWWAGSRLPAAAFDFAGRTLLGAAAVVAGLGVAVAAAIGFRRHHTTVDPLHPGKARALVTQGVFALSRNPMYLGMALVLAGLALLAGNALALLAPLAFVAFITRFQIVPEERALAAAFGDEFAAYRARVGRWL